MDSRLLEPGQAGDLTPDELAFIKVQLKSSKSLRRRWGIQGEGKRISDKRIRDIAMWGDKMPLNAPHTPRNVANQKHKV